MEIKFEDYDRQLNEYVEEAIDGVVENIMDVHYSHVTDEDERNQINIDLTNILKKDWKRSGMKIVKERLVCKIILLRFNVRNLILKILLKKNPFAFRIVIR